jgi:beta-phosphoglucomutase
MPSKPAAIIFDFDGVIGKTMEDNFIAWQQALRGAGVEIQKEQYFLLEGMKPSEVARVLLQDNAGAGPDMVARVIRAKEDHYRRHNSFTVYAGVPQLLQSLKSQAAPLGLVSGASRQRLQASLPPDLFATFDVVIGAEDVHQGKPDPECFLAAASQLDQRPDTCVVVENAPLGISAAKAAGMFCVALTSTLGPQHLTDADRILSGIPELTDYLLNGQETQ